MWATYRQYPICRSSLSQMATNDGIAVSCDQRESPRSMNKQHRSAKCRHRTAIRRQRLGKRPVESAPVVAGNVVYVEDAGGRIGAYRTE